MTSIYSIYSIAYLEQEVSNYNCYLDEKEWINVTSENPTIRLFARISNNGKEWYVALGQPIKTNFNNNNNNKSLFVPNWMIDQISVFGDGDSFKVEWIPVEFFENSTHICLKMVDSHYESNTIDEELSIELTKIGILQSGTKIYINIPSLDNYTVIYEVIMLEPANIVLCEGDEVSLEFIKDTSLIPTVGRPITPYPEELLLPPSAPVNEVNENVSNTLGGTKHEEKYNPWRSKDFKPPFS
jgi:hypothetical protein